MSSASSPGKHSTRSLVLSGLAWNTLFQFFGIALNFVVMLFTVRLISPSEFGKFATVTGILAFMNVLSCEVVISHAVQMREDQKPDWDTYWSLAVRQQFLLFVLCNLVAAILWALPAYRPVAPLLHLASMGLLWDSASRLRANMLRRELDFRRLRVLGAVCSLSSAAVTLTMALAGHGAVALVLGGYVVYSLPTVIELFWVHHWKPLKGWLAPVRSDSLRSILSFGFHQSGVGALAMARGALEAAVIPGLIGYAGFGLWNRAQVLFQTSAGRAVGIIAETAYPVLPRSSGDDVRYRRHATLFAQIVVAIGIFGAFYVGANGVLLSRVLYGMKWADADTLILPGTLFGFGSGVFLVAGNVLLAANNLRKRFIAISLQAVVGVLGISVLAFHPQISAYSWAVGTLQTVAGFASLLLASEYFDRGWFARVWLSPIVAGLAGTAAVLLIQRVESLRPVAQLVINSIAYGLIAGLVLRFGFPTFVRDSLRVVPKGEMIGRVLRLPDCL
jgi:O-antigen/teichoic acid export membrane protein